MESRATVGAAAESRAVPKPPFERRTAGGFPTGFAVGVAVLLLTLQPLAGFDTWWHLAAGREMARTGGLLVTDPFTFTVAGEDWRNHEWLWQVGAYGLFRLAGGGDGRLPGDLMGQAPAHVGTNGPRVSSDMETALLSRDRSEARGASVLTVVNGLLLTACFMLGFVTLLESNCRLPLAGALALFSAVGARPRFLARPEAVTLLVLALVLMALHRSRRSGRRAELAAIPLLIALGMNLHPGGLAVAVVVAIYLAGDLIARLPIVRDLLRARSDGAGAAGISPAPYLPVGPAGSAALLGSSLAATLLTPAGPGIWGILVDVTGVSRGESYYNPEWVSSTPANAPFLYITLAALAALLLIAWRGGGLDPPTVLVQAALGILAVSAYRHLGLFFVGLPFAAAVPLSVVVPAGPAPVAGRVSRGSEGVSPRRSDLPLALCLPALTIAWLFLQGGPALGVDRSTTPVDACRFIDLHRPEGRLYNDLRFGGYLDWRFAPSRPTFIDGRQELFTGLLPRLAAIHSGAASYESWLALIEDLSIEGAIVRYQEGKKGVLYPGEEGRPPVRGYRAYSAYLFPGSAWALVYWDDTAMVFLDRSGANDELIARYEYAALNPEDAEFLLERAEGDAALRAALARDIRRRVGENPPSLRAAELSRRMQERGW